MGVRFAAAALAFVANPLVAETPTPPPLGNAPTYSDRKIGTIPDQPLPNAAAIKARIWAPGLHEGFVPQGITVVGDSLYLGSYRSAEVKQGRGPCRLFRIAPATGKVTGTLDLPPSCGHSGGLAKGAAGRLWVVDTHVMHEITLTPENAGSIGQVSREVLIEAPLKGSFAAGDANAIWLGSYERDRPGRLYRVPLAAITGPSIGEKTATLSLELPSRAQGAAFDRSQQLWITRSGATLGELLRLDPATGAIAARYQVPDGIEDLSFDAAGQIWTVSEAGSRRWLGWATFFPVLFRLDPAALR